MRNAAAEAEVRWDSGDRHARLATRLSNLLGVSPEGRDAAEAILLTVQDQGAAPIDAVNSEGSRARTGRRFGLAAGRDTRLELG